MKLAIKDFCIRCGICIDVSSELFDMDYQADMIRIKVSEVPETLMEKAKESIKDCAVGAIHFQK